MSPCDGCRVVLVVMPFPCPLSAGGARAAGTDGTFGKSPSLSSSYPTGRDEDDPGQREMGGAPALSTPILIFSPLQGPQGRAGMKGEIGFPGRPVRPAPGLFVPLAIASSTTSPPPHLHILHPLNPKPHRVPEVLRCGVVPAVMPGCHPGAGWGTGTRLISAAHPQGRPGMNGLKGEKGDPADVSSVLGLRVSTAAVPSGCWPSRWGHTHRGSPWGPESLWQRAHASLFQGLVAPLGQGMAPVSSSTGTVHFAGP